MKTIFAERIAALMDQTGISQSELIERCKPHADAAGIKLTKSALSQYISGTKNPKFDKLKVIEQTFGVSAEWLAGYTDDPTVTPAPDSGINSLYDMLNLKGKQKVLDYIADLLESPNYRKEEEHDETKKTI